MSSDSENTSSSAIIDTSCTNESSPPKIFKLNVDCFENLFEWFSLSELLLFRSTCKRMKKVVDYYIKLNYPQLQYLIVRNRRHLSNICDTQSNSFEWIKYLSIESVELNDININGIKPILNRLEGLKLQIVRINGDLYEMLLKYCPQLKHLNLLTNTTADMIIGTSNEWLCRQYPTLEHIEIHTVHYAFVVKNQQPLPYIVELQHFFQLNPQIRIFSVDLDYLRLCERILLESNIQFDRLVIYVYHYMQSICNFMNVLHEHGVYKQLHLYNNDVEFTHVVGYNFSTFNNLEKIHFHTLPVDFTTTVVTSIKELSTRWFDILADIPKIIVENFINLKCVDIEYAQLDDIRSFVCHAPKLKQIRAVSVLDESLSIDSFIEMNEERKKLVRPCKVEIHIGEQLFLKFKWTTKIKFSLIELKRGDAREMRRLFYR